jgi:hypothetical protein
MAFNQSFIIFNQATREGARPHCYRRHQAHALIRQFFPDIVIDYDDKGLPYLVNKAPTMEP